MKHIMFFGLLCVVCLSSCESNQRNLPQNEDMPLPSSDEASETVFYQREDRDMQYLFAPSSFSGNDYSELEKSKHALALINHVNWVVSKIIHTSSIVVLEEEYSGVNADGLFLDCIEDEQIIELIEDIMNFITKNRLSKNERDFLKQTFEEEKETLLYNAIPNPTAIVSPEITTLLINFATSATTGYMRYKQSEQALEKQFKRDTFKLDQDAIENVNRTNTKLLRKTWDIIQKHKIDDSSRITVAALEELNQRLEDRNNGYKRRTYNYLISSEKTFMFLPEYWFFRGQYAGMNNERDDEINSYNHFQKIYYPFLRNDRIAASVAMNKCKILVEKDLKDYAAIEEQLEIILRNVESRDWEKFYFCGSIYLHILLKPKEANACFAKAVNHLENAFQEKVSSYYKEIDDNGKDKSRQWLAWDNNALLLCRTKLMLSCLKSKTENETTKAFKNILDDLSMSPFEFFPYFSNSNIIDCNFIRVFRESAFCHFDTKWYKTDDFEIIVPMRFFYCGFSGINVKFLSDGKVKKQIMLSEKDLSYKKIGGDNDNLTRRTTRCILCKTSYEFDDIKIDKIDCIDVVFPNKYHSITIRFANPGNPNKDITKYWIRPTHILCDEYEIRLDSKYVEPSQGQIANILSHFFE